MIWAETAQADAADTASGFRPTGLGLIHRRRSLLLLRDFFFALATIDYKGVVVAV